MARHKVTEAKAEKKVERGGEAEENGDKQKI